LLSEWIILKLFHSGRLGRDPGGAGRGFPGIWRPDPAPPAAPEVAGAARALRHSNRHLIHAIRAKEGLSAGCLCFFSVSDGTHASRLFRMEATEDGDLPTGVAAPGAATALNATLSRDFDIF